MLSLGEYANKEKFMAAEYEKNLERNFGKSRIAWTTTASDNVSINDRVK
jgi:hypothetical protein